MPAKKVISLLHLILACTVVWAQGPNSTGTYYEAANGKSGEALKTAFFNIITGRYRGTTFQQVEYTNSKTNYDVWHAFKTTDVLDDGVTIRDRYSCITNYKVLEDQLGTGGSSAEGGTPEKPGKYSREHSFPKSWFKQDGEDGTEVGPGTDLFHIYPTDGYINSSLRRDYPYGENNGELKHSAEYYSKVGTSTIDGYTETCFEPNDEWKGDFARTYFYMVTCYENKQNTWTSDMLRSNSYPSFSDWSLNMLLEWSRLDPVDSIEIARNEAVCAIQHNRNPFIDYPHLEDYIWGTKKSEAFPYGGYEDAIAKKYYFRKVTNVSTGKRYLIIANNNDSLRMALPLNSTSGYVQAENVEAKDDIVALEDTTYTFRIIAAPNDGYYFKDSKGCYIYQSTTGSRFYMSAALPEERSIWTIISNGSIVDEGGASGESSSADGTFKITNVERNNYIQYSTKYFSYGCYSNVQGLLPSLYEEVETLVGDVNRDGRVNIADVTALVNLFTDKSLRETDCYNLHAADANEDGVITKSDIQSLINIVLNK